MSGYFVANNNPSKLGGGAPGHQPQLIGGGANSNIVVVWLEVQKEDSHAMILRQAMGKNPMAQRCNWLCR